MLVSIGIAENKCISTILSGEQGFVAENNASYVRFLAIALGTVSANLP